MVVLLRKYGSYYIELLTQSPWLLCFVSLALALSSLYDITPVSDVNNDTAYFPQWTVRMSSLFAGCYLIHSLPYQLPETEASHSSPMFLYHTNPISPEA